MPPAKKTTAKKSPAKKAAAKKKATSKKPGRQPTDRQPKKTAKPPEPRKVQLRESTLTNRDMLIFEDAVGKGLDEVFDGSGRQLTSRESLAVWWLGMRMSGRPDLTWEQVLDMPITEMEDIDVELVDRGEDPEGDAAASGA